MFRVGIVNNVDQLEGLASGLAAAEANLAASIPLETAAAESAISESVA